MNKETFLLKTKYNSIIAKLSDKQAGILFKMIFQFVENGVMAGQTDDKVDMAFEFIKIDLLAFAESYAKKVGINSENGKKGGAPKGNNNAKKQPKTTENNRNKPNDNDNDNDSSYEEYARADFSFRGIVPKKEKIEFEELPPPKEQELLGRCYQIGKQTDAKSLQAYWRQWFSANIETGDYKNIADVHRHFFNHLPNAVITANVEHKPTPKPTIRSANEILLEREKMRQSPTQIHRHG